MRITDNSKSSRLTVGCCGRFFPGVFHSPWLIVPSFFILRNVLTLTSGSLNLSSVSSAQIQINLYDKITYVENAGETKKLY